MANSTVVKLVITAKNTTKRALDEVKSGVAGLQRGFEESSIAANNLGVRAGQAFEKVGRHADHATHKIGLFQSRIGNSIMQLMMLQMVGQMAFQGVAAVLHSTYGEVERYTMSVTQMAALIASFQTRGDPAKNYRKARDYAQGLVTTLEEIDAQTVASAGDLQLITEEMAKQRILLDTNNAAAVEGFKNLANAVAVIAGGYQNKEIQIRQEIRALMQGEVDMNSQLSQQINAMVGGGLRQKVELWKKEGRLIEEIGGLLKGYASASNDIEGTWAALGSTLETIKSRIMRLGFAEMYHDVNGQLMLMNGYLREHSGEIATALRKGWLAVKGLVVSIRDVLRAYEYPLGVVRILVRLVADGLGMVAAVALPTITEKLVQAVALLRDLVHLVYVFGRFFVDSVAVALESMGKIGKILYNIVTMNKEGLQAAIHEFNNMDTVASLKDDALLLKGVLEATRDDASNLFNLEGFDRRFDAYVREAKNLKAAVGVPDISSGSPAFTPSPDTVALGIAAGNATAPDGWMLRDQGMAAAVERAKTAKLELQEWMREQDLLEAQQMQDHWMLREQGMVAAVNREIKILRWQADQKIKIEQQTNATILNMKKGNINAALTLMQLFAGKSKAMALAALVVQKGIAMAETFIQTQTAASAAIAPPPLGLGPTPAGFALASAIETQGAIRMGLIAATGLAQAITSGGGGGNYGGGTLGSPVLTAPPPKALPEPATEQGQGMTVNITIEGASLVDETTLDRFAREIGDSLIKAKADGAYA